MKTKLLLSVFAWIAGAFASATEIDAGAQRLIGLETADLVAKSLPPEVAVYGSVLSPAPVIDLFRQIGTAQAAVDVSNQTSARVEKLSAAGELVARKEVEAARAQVVKDQAAVQALEDRLVLEWGTGFSKLSAQDRAKLLDDLLAGRRVLVRLAVSRAENPDSVPVAARLHAFGQEMKPIRCTSISPAPAIDPAFQSRTFLGVIERPDSPLAVGLALAGALELKGEPRAGVLVPQCAVVFHLGKGWIYQKEGGDEFERVEVPVDTAVEGGWFVAGGVLKSHPVVTKGAQSILSKETVGTAGEE